ncbi:MAG: flavin reductase family protein [Acidobacteriota bacterium]|nr:flavin reductase family protein [Acidobacteriota bacterium]
MINRNEFRAALGRFASGVTVITTVDKNGHRHGITVSAFCSVSLTPPLILICIEKTTGSHHAFVQNEFFAVNILRAGQQYLSDRFAAHLDDKFDGIEFYETERGIPVLKDVLVNLECRRVNAYDNGDHTIYVAAVERARLADGEPLVYFQGNYRQLETA